MRPSSAASEKSGAGDWTAGPAALGLAAGLEAGLAAASAGLVAAGFAAAFAGFADLADAGLAGGLLVDARLARVFVAAGLLAGLAVDLAAAEAEVLPGRAAAGRGRGVGVLEGMGLAPYVPPAAPRRQPLERLYTARGARLKSGTMTRSLASCLALAFVLSACTGSGGKTLEERMAEDPEKALLEKAGYVPKAKPRPPAGLPPPSDADLKAWDRKDPEGEKHLHKYDKANLKKLLNYFGELGCFREKVMAEGAKAMGAEPGSPVEEQWHQFKQLYVPMVNVWMQRLLANEPRIMEKSKLIGHFFEAHELVMNRYPVAYNDNDKVALETADANWLIVETKINKYLKNITNEEIPKPDLTDPKVKEKHDKFCLAALNPPKNTGKAKVKYVGGGGGGAKKLNMGDD